MSNFRPPAPTGTRHPTLLAGDLGPPEGAGPGPSASGHRPTGTGDSDAGARRELMLDVIQMVLDVVGIVEPTPFADSASAGISLGRRRWLDAALSGLSVIPYIGDLAKLGKLPRYVRTLERALDLAGRNARFAAQIAPAMQRLKRVLDLLPASSNAHLNRLKRLADRFLAEHRVARLTRVLPDISGRFRFSTRRMPNGNTHKTASGRLGVPGQVRVHRNTGAQRGVSGGTGDDAGHLIGNRFGAPGTAENLSLQNWRSNRGGGTFHDLENRWARQLESGHGIEVTITDVTRAGEARPFMRRAEWKQTAPDGTVTNHRLDFANPHTPGSRDRQNIPPTVTGSRPGSVSRLDDFRR